MSRTHVIEIEIEDNDGARSASDLASLAAGAAEFMQNALPDELDVTSVRCSTQTYPDPEFGQTIVTPVTVSVEDAPVPFDPPVQG